MLKCDTMQSSMSRLVVCVSLFGCAVGSPSGPYTESPPLTQCDDARAVVPCWYVMQDKTKCPENGQVFGVVRKGETTFNEGTILNVQCQACPDSDPAAGVIPGCDYKL